LLLAAGRLQQQVGGASIDPGDPQGTRRTVYARVSRLSLHPLLALFDFPDPNLHADRRVETTTPLQKLFVMNSPFMIRQAEAFSQRVNDETGGVSAETDVAFVQRAYSVLYGRPPLEAELQLGVAYLHGAGDRQQYAHVLLASSEAMYVD
jgi:hypothetical protein